MKNPREAAPVNEYPKSHAGTTPAADVLHLIWIEPCAENPKWVGLVQTLAAESTSLKQTSFLSGGEGSKVSSCTLGLINVSTRPKYQNLSDFSQCLSFTRLFVGKNGKVQSRISSDALNNGTIANAHKYDKNAPLVSW